VTSTSCGARDVGRSGKTRNRLPGACGGLRVCSTSSTACGLFEAPRPFEGPSDAVGCARWIHRLTELPPSARPPTPRPEEVERYVEAPSGAERMWTRPSRLRAQIRLAGARAGSRPAEAHAANRIFRWAVRPRSAARRPDARHPRHPTIPRPADLGLRAVAWRGCRGPRKRFHGASATGDNLWSQAPVRSPVSCSYRLEPLTTAATPRFGSAPTSVPARWTRPRDAEDRLRLRGESLAS
jgi:hypothetical protein